MPVRVTTPVGWAPVAATATVTVAAWPCVVVGALTVVVEHNGGGGGGGGGGGDGPAGGGGLAGDAVGGAAVVERQRVAAGRQGREVDRDHPVHEVSEMSAFAPSRTSIRPVGLSIVLAGAVPAFAVLSERKPL